ncbi:MAG TPA: Rne/Rng family ribonuclease [Ignavibacteriales bacterium]|nr:Rne/Rng family ribonuclease [Ignavibacteriales bacterium]
MVKEIIINSSTSQTRVAITEESNLVDFFVEQPEKRRMVGDIYLGRVARVLPGIKAAFIDVGMKHDGFLHFSDITDRLDSFKGMFDADDKGDDDDEAADSADTNGGEKTDGRPVIEALEKKTDPQKLRKGQDIIVQITKEPIGNKGVRLTTAISLPGRFCVLLPFDNKVGISKKISDFKERRRLRSIARSIIPKHFGLIIRTAAKDQTEESLTDDLKYLLKTWQMIEASVKSETPPSLVYQDLNTTSSVIRDLLTNDVTKVYVDSRKLFKQVKNYLHLVQPALIDKLELYKGQESIFEFFKIEEQIQTLLGRKVSLPSGGYLIIEHTEAMVVVDVNSGRYAARKDQELNSLKTDLEAAREVVRQLRLRDIGGLIVCDFIDLEDEKNRKKIYDEFKKEFRKDRAKVSLLPMTDFGIVQITRQRIRQNIMQTMNDACPYCLGTGLMTKQSNILHDIEDWLKKFRSHSNIRYLILEIHPTLAKTLQTGFMNFIMKLQLKFLVRIKVKLNDKVHPASFKFFTAKSYSELTVEE